MHSADLAPVPTGTPDTVTAPRLRFPRPAGRLRVGLGAAARRLGRRLARSCRTAREIDRRLDDARTRADHDRLWYR